MSADTDTSATPIEGRLSANTGMSATPAEGWLIVESSSMDFEEPRATENRNRLTDSGPNYA